MERKNRCTIGLGPILSLRFPSARILCQERQGNLPTLGYRETISRLIKQVTIPDRADTVFEYNKLRPFELIIPHENLDHDRQKPPHVPEEVLGRDQNQGHAARRVRVRRGRLRHRLHDDGEMVSEILTRSCYATCHGKWWYGAPVAVELNRQTSRVPMSVERVRESSYRGRCRHWRLRPIHHDNLTIPYWLRPPPKKDKLRSSEPIILDESPDRSRCQRPFTPGQLFVRTQEQRHTAVGVNVGIHAHRRLRSSRLNYPLYVVIRGAHAVFEIGVTERAPVAVELDGEYLRYHDEVIWVGKDATTGDQGLVSAFNRHGCVATWVYSGLCSCSVAVVIPSHS